LASPSSGVNATVLSVVTPNDGSSNWILSAFEEVSMQTVSQSDAKRYSANLIADQTGWTTPPSTAAIQALAQQSNYSTAYQQLTEFNGHNSILLNVQTISVISPFVQDAIAVAADASTIKDVISDSSMQWPLNFGLAGSNLAAINFTTISGGFVLVPDVNRRSRMVNQPDSNDMFPVFARQQGVTPQPWYVSVVDHGTSYNSTSVNWVTVVLQHSWWLGWYLGVCTDCEWGQSGPAVVMMQANETNPVVQWMIFQSS